MKDWIQVDPRQVDKEISRLDPKMFWLMYYTIKVRNLYTRLEPWGA